MSLGDLINIVQSVIKTKMDSMPIFDKYYYFRIFK